MKQIFLVCLFLIFFSCRKNESKTPIKISEVIIEATNITYKDLNDIEKQNMIFTKCCCHPTNWNEGIDCIEKEDAFYVKAKININLLAALTESETFSIDDLITSNPHLLYGKYRNRWLFIDENDNQICENDKTERYHSFNLNRKDTIDELILGPLNKKPNKMLIQIDNSKYYEGIIPEIEIR